MDLWKDSVFVCHRITGYAGSAFPALKGMYCTPAPQNLFLCFFFSFMQIMGIYVNAGVSVFMYFTSWTTKIFLIVFNRNRLGSFSTQLISFNFFLICSEIIKKVTDHAFFGPKEICAKFWCRSVWRLKRTNMRTNIWTDGSTCWPIVRFHFHLC